MFYTLIEHAVSTYHSARYIQTSIISATRAIDDIGGGAREVICGLNGSFGSPYFLSVMNGRTSFVLRVRAFESSRSDISLL